MTEWLREHGEVAGWLFGVSAIVFVGTLVVIPFLVVRMRSDHFLTREPFTEVRSGRTTALGLVLRLLKNALGVVLVLAGIVLSVPLIPGQGVLTIFVGLSLLNFPGKRALELRLIRQRPVLAAINWIRKRAGRPALELPPSPKKG